MLCYQKAIRTVEYYQKKFANMKDIARKRDQMVAKQKQTGGGSLTPHETRVVNSSAYMDLASKLGISASGNDPRADSDGNRAMTRPPTDRLACVLETPTDDMTFGEYMSQRM